MGGDWKTGYFPLGDFVEAAGWTDAYSTSVEEAADAEGDVLENVADFAVFFAIVKAAEVCFPPFPRHRVQHRVSRFQGCAATFGHNPIDPTTGEENRKELHHQKDKFYHQCDPRVHCIHRHVHHRVHRVWDIFLL